MIKFFRKIRQNLLMKNQTGKYFKYAIGEIILVVIGILIALQINNWNQKRLEKRKSIEYHKRIAEELDLKVDNFKWDSIRGSNITKHLISSVKILEKDKISQEEIDTLDFTLKNYFQFVQIDGTLNSFEEIQSSGDLGLIYNQDLRKSINYYIARLSAISKIYNQLSSQVNETTLTDKYIRNDVKLFSETEIKFDPKELKKDKVLINQLSRFAEHWKTKVQFSGRLIFMSKNLKSKILTELEND